MKLKVIIYICSIFLLWSCGQKNGSGYSFQDVQISTSDNYLVLPSGFVTDEVNSYEEGFTQHFIYSDSSYVIILKGSNADLAVPGGQNTDNYSREQNVEGIQMLYGNVRADRKAEFDQAFDLMKKNRLKKE